MDETYAFWHSDRLSDLVINVEEPMRPLCSKPERCVDFHPQSSGESITRSIDEGNVGEMGCEGDVGGTGPGSEAGALSVDKDGASASGGRRRVERRGRRPLPRDVSSGRPPIAIQPRAVTVASMGRLRPSISRFCASAATAIAIISTCPLPIDSLAFDVSSRSSSSFASSCGARIAFPTRESTAETDPRRSAPSRWLQMKVSPSGKRGRDSKSSRLIERNNERLRTAGRPGTKNFMDPNKVFIGNLPYDADEGDVYRLFAEHWNVPVESVGDRVESVKVIRDWRTGKSKGYGFIQFYEPMTATSAMESVNRGRGWRIKGRRVRLDQGKRKPDEEDAKRKKKKKEKLAKEDLDEEGMVIHSALEDVEGAGGGAAASDDGDDGEGMSEEDMITFIEKGGLRGVMPLTEETAGFLGIEGLYDDDDDGDDYFAEFYSENGYSDEDFGDLEEDDEDDDSEELVYDGVFEEMYNPNEYEGLSKEEEEEAQKMNREQRRAAEKRRKKRKLPFKGFGSP